MRSLKWLMMGILLWAGVTTAQAADLLPPKAAAQAIPVISVNAPTTPANSPLKAMQVPVAQTPADISPLSEPTKPSLPDWLFPDGATVTGDPVVWDGTTLTIPSGTTVNVTGRLVLPEHSDDIKSIQVSGTLANAFINSNSPIFIVSGSGTLTHDYSTETINTTLGAGSTLFGTGGTIGMFNTDPSVGGTITTGGSTGIVNTSFNETLGTITLNGNDGILTTGGYIGIINTNPGAGSTITTGGTIGSVNTNPGVGGTITNSYSTGTIPFSRELQGGGTDWERQNASESLKGMIANIISGQKPPQKRMRAEAQKMVDFLEQSLTGLGSLNTSKVELVVEKRPGGRQTDIIKVMNRDGKFAELRIEYDPTGAAPTDVRFSSGSILRNNGHVATADIKKYLNLYANSADMPAAKDALEELSKGGSIAGSFYFWSPIPAASYMDFTSTVQHGKTTVEKILRVWGDGHVSYTEMTITTGPITHGSPLRR